MATVKGNAAGTSEVGLVDLGMGGHLDYPGSKVIRYPIEVVDCEKALRGRCCRR